MTGENSGLGMQSDELICQRTFIYAIDYVKTKMRSQGSG